MSASGKDKSWKEYKGTQAGLSWSPRGQGGLSGEVGQLRGGLTPGAQVPRPKPLVEEEQGILMVPEVWDLGHIAQLGWLVGYRSWDCEKRVCPQATAGDTPFPASRQHVPCLPRVWVGSATGGPLEREGPV